MQAAEQGTAREGHQGFGNARPALVGRVVGEGAEQAGERDPDGKADGGHPHAEEDRIGAQIAQLSGSGVVQSTGAQVLGVGIDEEEQNHQAPEAGALLIGPPPCSAMTPNIMAKATVRMR
jgi:hypothetical protein